MACGKRIHWGEEAVAIAGTVHCLDCWAEADRRTPQAFNLTLRHGLICGGGFEQD
jgi:hypothetical protein